MEQEERVTFFWRKKVFEEFKCEDVSVYLMKPEMMFFTSSGKKFHEVHLGRKIT